MVYKMIAPGIVLYPLLVLEILVGRCIVGMAGGRLSTRQQGGIGAYLNGSVGFGGKDIDGCRDIVAVNFVIAIGSGRLVIEILFPLHIVVQVVEIDGEIGFARQAPASVEVDGAVPESVFGYAGGKDRRIELSVTLQPVGVTGIVTIAMDIHRNGNN